MNLIVGGVNVSILVFNFIVGLVLFYHDLPILYCGGSYLGNGTIITAAHCVKNLQEENTSMRVYYNLQSLNNFSGSDFFYEVSRFKMHERFNLDNLSNDVALLKIPVADVPIKNVLLPTDPYSFRDTYYILGYGFTDYKNPHLDLLHLGEVNILNKDLYPNLPTDDSMLIAQGNINGTIVDTCKGDSGGPLFQIDREGNHYLYGITSWGIGCADVMNPGVYSDVYYMRGWIKKNIDF